MFRNIFSRALIHHFENKNVIKFSLGSPTVNRQIHYGVCLRNPRQTSKPNNDTSPAISSKYQVISEDNALVIENTDEEINYGNPYPLLSDEYDGINLQRGQRGVFDIEDLVDLLRRENSKDIFVATVPQNINYVDYICIVSGRSKRHIQALAEFIKKVYKKKCYKTDLIPRIEGKQSDEWLALDLGNIALHIFSERIRIMYDLETLWSVGHKHDDLSHKKNEGDIFADYTALLKDLKPLS